MTSYDYVMRDACQLRTVDWHYIVVDEAHRLKNIDSKLVQSLKDYSNKKCLLLTGTPLSNNLNELWALLNFALPHVFEDGSAFDEWFDWNSSKKHGEVAVTEEEEMLLVQRLQQLLRPFLLRREKREVLGQLLPPKTESILYCPLSCMQKVPSDHHFAWLHGVSLVHLRGYLCRDFMSTSRASIQ